MFWPFLSRSPCYTWTPAFYVLNTQRNYLAVVCVVLGFITLCILSILWRLLCVCNLCHLVLVVVITDMTVNRLPVLYYKLSQLECLSQCVFVGIYKCMLIHVLVFMYMYINPLTVLCNKLFTLKLLSHTC